MNPHARLKKQIELLQITLANDRRDKYNGIGDVGVSGVLGCGPRPHAKLSRRTERGHRTVAANMSLWSANSDNKVPPAEH